MKVIWLVGSRRQYPSILCWTKEGWVKMTFDFMHYEPSDFIYPSYEWVTVEESEAIINGNNPALKLVSDSIAALSTKDMLYKLYKLCNWFYRFNITQEDWSNVPTNKPLTFLNDKNITRIISRTAQLFYYCNQLGLI